MSTQHLPFLLFLLLLSSLSASAIRNPGAAVSSAEEAAKAKEVVVEGMVYCQSCKLAGTWSLEGATPLPSAKVGVACKDRKNRVSLYKSVSTDNRGYFYAQLQGLSTKSFSGERRVSACTAHLLSSPDRGCDLLTNINHGIEGSPLRYGNKTVSGRSYEAAVYAAGPLAFRPGVCHLTNHY